MKKFLILILLCSFCLPQKNNKRKNYNNKKPKQTLFSTMNEEAKMTFFQSQKLSPEIASIYQLAFPVPFLNLGYSYSNNWKKGAMTDIAILVLLAAKEDEQDDAGGDSSEQCKENVRNIEIAMGVVTLFKVFKANQLAGIHNKKMFKKLFGVRNPEFSFNYSKDKKSPELSLSFPLN